MLYHVASIDARNVAYIIASDLTLEQANRMRADLMIRHPDQDFVVQSVGSTDDRIEDMPRNPQIRTLPFAVPI